MRELYKLNYQDVMIIITFFLFWISIQFEEVIEDTIAYFFVLSLGIIHGANDINILQKNNSNKKHFWKSLINYLAIILICIAGYLVTPQIAILSFIILSAYHFGEQHLEKKIGNIGNWNGVTYTIYGLFIFALLFHENIEDVQLIVSSLTNTSIEISWIQYSLAISSVLLFVVGLALYISKNDQHINYFKELLYLFVLFLVFKTGSLIFGFAIYFVFWHSIPSISDQIEYLFGSKNEQSVKKYFKAASIYWVISIFGLIAGYYFLETHIFKTVLFLILFAVTAPHTWVMKSMKA